MDYEKLAAHAGFKNAKVAGVSWPPIRKKLEQGATAPGDDAEASTPKKRIAPGSKKDADSMKGKDDTMDAGDHDDDVAADVKEEQVVTPKVTPKKRRRQAKDDNGEEKTPKKRTKNMNKNVFTLEDDETAGTTVDDNVEENTLVEGFEEKIANLDDDSAATVSDNNAAAKTPVKRTKKDVLPINKKTPNATTVKKDDGKVKTPVKRGKKNTGTPKKAAEVPDSPKASADDAAVEDKVTGVPYYKAATERMKQIEEDERIFDEPVTETVTEPVAEPMDEAI